MIEKIVSGGQTGVDRAALDAALDRGLPCGGWCPRGRRAEDGPIPARYPLIETPTVDYAERTRWNVRDSDGTLILTRGDMIGGTRLTAEFAASLTRPLLVIDLAAQDEDAVVIARIRDWIERSGICILNVAGPRECGCPGIHGQAGRLIGLLLESTRSPA